MGFDDALRLTEILLAFALIQHSIEHVFSAKNERYLFVVRIFLSVLMALGVWTGWVCAALVILSLVILKHFQGPYNGGSDRMGLLVLWCVAFVHWMQTLQLTEYIFGYLAVQLLLSYFISGWVKIVNPDWRSGRALQDVFQFSTYPASEQLRSIANHPWLLFCASWSVMIFELSFPLALITQATLIIGLMIAALFHFANACLFGLNRFFWIWLTAYPSLLWLHTRIFGM